MHLQAKTVREKSIWKSAENMISGSIRLYWIRLNGFVPVKIRGLYPVPQAISRGLEGLIDGFWQDLLYQPDAFDREDARKTCYEYLEVVFPDVNKNEAVESRFNNSYQQGYSAGSCRPE